MESIGRNGLVRLQGEDSLMYLCFNNKGRLRARVSISKILSIFGVNDNTYFVPAE